MAIDGQKSHGGASFPHGATAYVPMPARASPACCGAKDGRARACGVGVSPVEHRYLSLRPFAGLWGSVLQLTAAAGGAGCAKLAREPMAAVAGVRERLRVDQVARWALGAARQAGRGQGLR